MPDLMKAVIVEKDQPLRVGEVEKPQAGAGEILLKVKAAGLNRGDLLQRAGMYPPPPGASSIMGLEASGVVVEIGTGVRRWKVGDRVCALIAGGGYGEYINVDEGSCLPIPENLDFLEAACLTETMMTVYTNVFEQCGLQSGEVFLVHGGSSGIGVSAIQMAKAAGATVYTTAGSDEKCQACLELGADRAVNYKTEDFEVVFSELGGVDVVLDIIGGDYTGKNLKLLKPKGRIVNIGAQNAAKAEINIVLLMVKRAILTGSTLRARSKEEKSSIREGLEARFWPLVSSGEIRPVIDKVFPVSEAEAAHARMASSQHIGKILLDMEA